MPIELIKEPEAAAFFTLNQLKGQGLHVSILIPPKIDRPALTNCPVQEGDAVTICDAGGGTVDLVSYEILKMWPELELKELVPASGGIAGSMMINNRFEDFVKSTVGEETFFQLKKTEGWRRALKNFDETIKPGFRSRDDEPEYIHFPLANLPNNKDRGINNDQITATG